MLRKLLCGAVLLAICGMVAADDFFGQITKVDGDKITVQKTKKGEKGKKPESDGEPVTLTVSKDCKIMKMKFDKDTKKMVAGDPVDMGLKNEMFSKTVTAKITADGSTVTAIAVMGGGGKKKKDN